MKNKILMMSMICVLAASSLAGCAQKNEEPEASDQAIAIEQTEPAPEEKPASEEEPMVGMANPWVDITEEEAKEQCTRLFKAPDGATATVWRKCDSLGDPDKYLGPLIQLDFELDGQEFTARAQQGAQEDADISGVYADWTVGPEENTLSNWGGGNMTCKTYRAINEEGYTDLITWYDIEIGIKYSLTVSAPDLDGFDIMAVADAMYNPDNEPRTE
ncbi:MAG: hypothetical protein K6E49_04930 [Lachnospiraceae bacterium]|nr:hypothetical protein [Lachnospiraceae bacterium]